ncbi:MAG: glycoside hydrolase, partial [Bacteroidales bacterium]|nr:glycoside hydrolase [Bacteroidales bacterium]
MKKFVLLISILAFMQISFAQLWRDYLPQNKGKETNYTLFDYQKAFKTYCNNYKLKNQKTTFDQDPENKEFGVPGYSQFKRWEWYWEPRVDQKTGEFPKKSAWEVWQDFKTKNKSAVKSVGGTWTSRGDAILDPIDGGSIQESGTGRLNCAFFVPGDDNHFFAGAPAGGLWETTDNGTTWTCLTDNNPVLGVSDIALPPDYNKTTNPTIYIATGDRDAGDDPSIGILKTADGGATWTQTGLDFHDKSGVKIGRIIINPDDKNIMWAATSLGMYRSADQGATWSFVQGGNFIDMELLPGSTGSGAGTIIATTYGWNPKVYRSTDGGLTWTNTKTGTADEFRCDVAVTPAAPNTVYITTADGTNNMAFYGLFKSTDGGVNWTQVYSGSTNNLYGWGANNALTDGGQGWYDATLAVSNTTDQVVYIGGVNGFVSTNGGSSFTICNAWDSGNGADVIHADHHNAYFRLSDNRLFDVNDGGFYYGDNVTSGGSSVWYAKTDGIVTGQIYDIGVAQTYNNEIISGFQDNGTKLVKSTSTDFDQVIGGDGMCCAINPTSNSIQYGTYAQMRVYKSTNDGGSFSVIRNSTNPPDAAWAGPVEADPQGGEVYIGDDKVKQYTGNATNWTSLSQSLDATDF